MSIDEITGGTSANERWGGRNPPQRGREEREAAEAAARDRVVKAAMAFVVGGSYLDLLSATIQLKALVAGEIYPCKADVFEATYEPAEE